MIYKGYFTSINDINYRVDIYTDEGDDVKEFTLSSSPVTISYESTDNIFKPTRLAQATIQAYIDEHMFNIYSAKAQGVKCIIYDQTNNQVFWQGYATPCAYNQDIGYKVALDIDCIDGLSTLKHKKYIADTKDVVSFYDIVKDSISKTNLHFSKLYVSNFSSLKLEEMYISENNFFDEHGEAMTYLEVLENMLTYLNLTIYQQKDEVYIIDYNNIDGEYVVYDLITDQIEMITTLQNNINTDDYIKDRSSDLSLGEVYNKITIRSSLYGFDSYIPSPNDEKNLYRDDEKYFQVTTIDDDYTYIHNYLFNSKLKYYSYNWDFSTDRYYPEYFIPDNRFGANNIKTIAYKTKEKPAEPNWDYLLVFNNICHNPNGGGQYDDTLNYIGGKRNGSDLKTDEYDDLTHNPFALEITTDQTATFSASYLQLKFDTFFSTNDIPVPNANSNYKKDDWVIGASPTMQPQGYKIPKIEPSVICQLNIGDYWWNGTEWTKTQSNFLVGIGEDEEEVYDRWISTRKTNTVENGINTIEHYVIKLPDDWILLGKINFKMATPRAFRVNNGIDYVFIKNLELKYISTYIDNDMTKSEYEINDTNTDTVWTTEIDSDHVNEFDDIDLKVASNTEKGLNLGSVMYKDGEVFKFVEDITKYGNESKYYFEEYLLDAYYNHFSTPKKSINMSVADLVFLNNKVDGNMVLNGIEYDLDKHTTRINLVEL